MNNNPVFVLLQNGRPVNYVRAAQEKEAYRWQAAGKGREVVIVTEAT